MLARLRFQIGYCKSINVTLNYTKFITDCPKVASDTEAHVNKTGSELHTQVHVTRVSSVYLQLTASHNFQNTLLSPGVQTGL